MKKYLSAIIIGVAVIAVVALILGLRTANDHGTFLYPGGELDVLVADNLPERTKGLSGTEVETLGADGMIFIFPDKQERTFWMKDMNYPLDVVWIADNKIVKISRNVPAPEEGEEPEYMHSRPFEVDMVLEMPHGYVDYYGLATGHIIEFQR